MQTLQRLAIVENDLSIRDSLSRLLTLKGFDVVAYGCAEDFLAQNTMTSTDLILSDIEMPGMDGFQLLRRLQDLNINTPIILMSGRHSLDNKQSLELGVAAFISKPFLFGDLLANFRMHIAR